MVFCVSDMCHWTSEHIGSSAQLGKEDRDRLGIPVTPSPELAG